MNTRIVLSAAFAAGILFVSAPMQAQAPVTPSEQKLEAKVESLQAQIGTLQAQVKRLQAQVRIFAPRRGVTPIDQLPPFQVPNFHGQGGFGSGGNFGPNRQFPPFPYPGIPQDPGIQGYLFQAPQGRQQPQVIGPQPYWNIPPCSVTLINQKTR